MQQTNQSKSVYNSPKVEHIPLDSEISLNFASVGIDGPGDAGGDQSSTSLLDDPF